MVDLVVHFLGYKHYFFNIVILGIYCPTYGRYLCVHSIAIHTFKKVMSSDRLGTKIFGEEIKVHGIQKRCSKISVA